MDSFLPSRSHVVDLEVDCLAGEYFHYGLSFERLEPVQCPTGELLISSVQAFCFQKDIEKLQGRVLDHRCDGYGCGDLEGLKT